MFRKTLFTILMVGLVAVAGSNVEAQSNEQGNKESNTQPKPSPTPVRTARNVKRTSGVKLVSDRKADNSSETVTTPSSGSQTLRSDADGESTSVQKSTISVEELIGQPKTDEVTVKSGEDEAVLNAARVKAEAEKATADKIAAEKAEAQKAEADKVEAEKVKAERIEAGLAALEREKKKSAEEAVRIAREEYEKREADLKKKADEERASKDAEIERIKAEQDAERKRVADEAELQRKKLEADAEAERVRAAEAKAAEDKNAEEEKADRERKIAEANQRAEVEAIAKAEAEKKEQAARAEAEQAEKRRIESERVSTEKLESEKLEKKKMRDGLVDSLARKLKIVNIADSHQLVPEEAATPEDIENALKAAIAANPRLVKRPSFCDMDYEGAPFNLEMSADDTFGTLLQELRVTFGINFLPDAEVLELPVRVNVDNEPWNTVLRSQLNFLDLEARCSGSNTISILKRTKLQTLQENQRKTAPLKTEFIKLRYLRPQLGAQSNLAGKPTATASVESLESTIQKILVANGDNRGSISRIPGRAEFFISATEEQLAQIKDVIGKADRPTYRVDIFGLVYTVNENKLRDVGSQLSIALNADGGARAGGFSTLPSQSGSSGTGSGSSGGSTQGSVIEGLPKGFTQPSGALGAGTPNSILGARVKLSFVEFAYQLSLLEQLGVARRVEKPFVSAKDGTTGTFENGTQIPVIVQALNNFGSAGGQIDFINAGTTLSATPQVIEGDDGKPQLVNLSLQLSSNTPDLSITTSGNVPAVSARRVQNEITIAPNQAFIFGGSNDLIDTNNVSRTPGLGSLPVIGNLFKRKSKQQTDNKLYFAVWVGISLDDGTSPVDPQNLDTKFLPPPPSTGPLTLPGKPKN